MTAEEVVTPKVFISYSHDSKAHAEKVLALADALMANGIDVILDQYDPFPDTDWPRWMQANLEAANFVLMVCTEPYNRRVMEQEGSGVHWEGTLIYNLIYKNSPQRSRYIPILFEESDLPHIPAPVQGHSRYHIQQFDVTDSGYESLYRHLTDQNRTPRPPLGPRLELSPQQRGPQTNQPIADRATPDQIFTVPYARNPVFTGREDVLAELERALDSGKPTAITQPLALSGLGGIGKTQTAVEYAYRYRNRYEHIFWVRAETSGELQDGFLDIARRLALPEADPESTIRSVQTWLQNHPGWLLIFDNADDLRQVRPYMPQVRSGHVLLTTRAKATGNLASPVRVPELIESEGALLLLRRAQVIGPDMPIEKADAKSQGLALDIAKVMYGLPLALDQAGAYIEETGCGLERYLELYRQCGDQMLAKQSELDDQGHPSVAVTFTLAFANLEKANPAAADMLRCCAFLAADAIPEEIFLQGATELGETLEKAASNPLIWEETVKEACRYSLLNRERDSTFGIHRLVQVVLQNAMDVETRKHWQQRIAMALDHIFPFSAYGNWELCERLITHTMTCAKWMHESNIGLGVIARLLNKSGRYLRDHARYTEAEPLLTQAMEVHADLFRTEHPDTATYIESLSLLHSQLGRHAEAEQLDLKVLAIREKLLGSEHPATITAMSNLGSTYTEQRKFVEAEPLLKRVLEVREKMLGPEHSHTLLVLTNLGMLYIKQHKYVDAEPLFKQALEMHEKVLGPEHPDTAMPSGALAHLYAVRGKYAEAEALQVRAFAIREKALGLEHPHTLLAMHNLGMTYARLGKYVEAEQLLKRSSEASEKVLGPDHSQTIESMNNLRWFYEQKEGSKRGPKK